MHRIFITFFAGLTVFAAATLPMSALAAKDPGREPALRSGAALVLDQETGQILLDKNGQLPQSIASITKLMTAMVILDAGLDQDELITVTKPDVDRRKGSRSSLGVGATMSRDDMLRIALMASENRAAAALARSYPGGTEAFVQAMNLKARLIGMTGTYFKEPTGLSSGNISTADDLSRLVRAAHTYPKIREYSTTTSYQVKIGRRTLRFHNTNRLVMSRKWDIGLSKTGYISEAGRCLVMQATLAGRAVVIVLLDSWGKYSRIGDAYRIRKWLEYAVGHSQNPAGLASGVRQVSFLPLSAGSEPPA